MKERTFQTGTQSRSPFTAEGEFDKNQKTSKSWTVGMKRERVTTQMKVLDEFILMELIVLLLKRIHFLVSYSNESSRRALFVP